MPYTADKIELPSTPTVGEPFTITAFYSSTAEDNRDTEARLYFNGNEIGSKKLVHQGAFQSKVTSGQHIFQQAPASSGPNYELEVNRFGGGSITVTEPGTYDVTLSIIGGGQITETVEVVKPVIDTTLVSGSCAIDAPDSPSPGDQITLTETLSNGNSEPVDVSLTFSLGGATQTRSVTVPANGSETASATFTAKTEGKLDPKVEFTVQT